MPFKDSLRSNEQEATDNLADTSMMMMRRWVGYIGLTVGVVLPLVTQLLTPCGEIQESISHYYYSVAGPVFVGLLWAVGFFLLCYPGQGEYEDYLTNIAGFLIIIVACFPTGFHQQHTGCSTFFLCYDGWVSTVHLSSAALFFVILGGVSFWLFPRPDPRHSETAVQRRRRNRLYRLAGVLLWLGIAALAPMVVSDKISLFQQTNKVVFIIEVLMLIVFGSVWLYKGRWQISLK